MRIIYFILIMFLSVNFSYADQQVRDFALGVDFGCAITTDDQFFCWGNNKKILHDQPATSGVSQFSAFKDHACAIIEGKTKCWGENTSGEIEAPSNLKNVRSVAVGSNFSCAATATKVKCWGSKISYKKIYSHSFSDIKKIAIEPNASLRIGFNHICVLDGTEVSCFSDGDLGLIQPPSNLKAVSDIRVGNRFACGKEKTGWRCWGDERYFGLAFKNGRTPLDIDSKSWHSNQVCHVTQVGSVKCLDDYFGKAPSDVIDFTRVVAGVVDGEGCAISEKEGLFCWGGMYRLPMEKPIPDQLQQKQSRYNENMLKDFLGCYSNGVELITEDSLGEVYPDGSSINIVSVKGSPYKVSSAIDDVIKIIPNERLLILSKTKKINKDNGKPSDFRHYLKISKDSNGLFLFYSPYILGSFTKGRKVPCQ